MIKGIESRRYFSLGVGTADIFFILLAFFLTLASPKEKKIFRLPLTADTTSADIKRELSPWRMVVPRYDPEEGIVFTLESVEGDTLVVSSMRFTLKEARVDTITYDQVKNVFDGFILKEIDRGVDPDTIRAFDIFAYFGSPSGIVFTAIDVCRIKGKKTTLIYERRTEQESKNE